MSPEERRLLSELFDRVKGVAGTPRDREAEDLIAQMLREQPYSAYYLAQAVIVQEQALKATTQRLQELEDQVQRLEAEAGSNRQQNTGFLGSLGSLFGGSQQQQTLPSRDSYAQREGRLYDDYARTNRYRDPEPEPMPPSPWGRDGAASPWAQPRSGMLGGGFLSGALTTAAGVAGGVLVADAVKDLFSPHMGGTNPAAGLGSFGDTPVQETVVNNFFGDNDRSNDRDDRGDRDSGGGGGDYDNDDNNNNDDDFDIADYGDDDDTFA
jgi:hypothetical protein